MKMEELPQVYNLSNWNTHASDYDVETVGDARIIHEPYTKGYYPFWGIDGYLFYRVKSKILLTSLQIRGGHTSGPRRWKTWMVDDPPQWRSMQIFAEKASGKVLTCGLGLGLVAKELARNPHVDKVVVVERDRDVIQLVGKYLPPHVEVVRADFEEYIGIDHTRWDHVIVDLWVSDGTQEKVRLLVEEVLPMDKLLRLTYPFSKISYHGFVSLSDVKVVDVDVRRAITTLKPYG